jgi:hypothetical protein
MTIMKMKQLAVAVTAAGVGICSAVSASPLAAHAAGPVANYLLAPSPIGAPAALPANATVTVTLTAVDATNAPVSGATVFLTFKHTVTGGGSAVVGITALTLKPQSFVTDTSGHIAITYKTPPTLPPNGEDLVTAQNVASHPTIRVSDHYTFDSVKRYKMTPHPIAVTASLHANATVIVTLTALNSSHAGVSGAVVYLLFAPATGGGSASVGSTALTSSPQAFTANSGGVISITYKTSAVPPTSGIDTITARSAPTHPIIVASDTYTF